VTDKIRVDDACKRALLTLSFSLYKHQRLSRGWRKMKVDVMFELS